jgi:hypothetical protein
VESEFLFEDKLQLGLRLRIAATTRVSGIALIAADKQVLLELGHEFNLQDFQELPISDERGGSARIQNIAEDKQPKSTKRRARTSTAGS